MEARLFEEGTIPEYATAAWYAERERAPHVDEAMHRPRLEIAAQFVRHASMFLGLSTVSDLGAGDGGLLQLLADEGDGDEDWPYRDLDCWGYDLQQSNVDGAAERGVEVTLLDVIALPNRAHYGEIVVATEMIEHLVDPHGFVKHLFDNTAAKALVASSPYTETAESHYGYHLWAWDCQGYTEMIEAAGWRVQTLRTTGMFQVVLAVRP